MDVVVFFTVLTILYLMAFFFDCFFKSCMHYPYDAFLRNTGLKVEFMRLKWHTTAFNRPVFRWGSSSLARSWLSKSFTMGVVVSLSLLPLALIAMFMTIFGGAGNRNNVKTELKSDAVKLEIFLPGVNLPLEEIGFYITTLMLSTIIHELGHALAAVLEDIPITGFGFQVYFCIPLAYTEISSEHLNMLKWFKKLRILCAGVWHNVIFAGVCYLLLSSLGLLWAPLYTLDKNVIVTHVTKDSPLLSKDGKGFSTGDIITQINDCRIVNDITWYSCLLKAVRSKPEFCVSSDFIRLNDESIDNSHYEPDGTFQCCDNKNEKLCCFEYIDDMNNGPVEIPQHQCLDVRRTIEESHGYCVASTCDQGFCLRPLLRNTTTILNVKRFSLQGRKLRDIVYIGHPADIALTVRVSPFVPKQKYIMSHWGDNFTLFLKYNIVFSIGMALVNVIPCFGLDGSHIAATIVHSFLVHRVTERNKRDIIALIVTSVGTVLFALGILKVMWLSVIRKIL